MTTTTDTDHRRLSQKVLRLKPYFCLCRFLLLATLEIFVPAATFEDRFPMTVLQRWCRLLLCWLTLRPICYSVTQHGQELHTSLSKVGEHQRTSLKSQHERYETFLSATGPPSCEIMYFINIHKNFGFFSGLVFFFFQTRGNNSSQVCLGGSSVVQSFSRSRPNTKQHKYWVDKKICTQTKSIIILAPNLV